MIDTVTCDYGMGNGFSILTSKCNNGIGAVSIVGDKADRSFSQYIKEHVDELKVATEMFHNHIVSRNYEVAKFIIPTMFFRLNKIQRQVLKCLLECLPVPQIAKRVYRSKLYIEKLVRNIRLKVGEEDENGNPRITTKELIHFCGLMQVSIAL